MGRRNALAIARLNAALVIRRSTAVVIDRARRVLGTLGKAPVSVHRAEPIISRGTWTGEEQDQIAQYASEAVRDSIPGRPTMEYKARAVKGVVHLALERISHG
jgi:CO/xanthine dehydrogenase FAD-binding subunit